MTGNVTKRLNLLAMKINRGDDLNVYQENGFATVIQIALMALMKILLFTTVHRPSHAAKACSRARMDAVSTRYDNKKNKTKTISEERIENEPMIAIKSSYFIKFIEMLNHMHLEATQG